MDVGSDSSAVVTGHMDGILRVWDLRTGTRTIDICGTLVSLPQLSFVTRS